MVLISRREECWGQTWMVIVQSAPLAWAENNRVISAQSCILDLLTHNFDNPLESLHFFFHGTSAGRTSE